MPTLSVPAPRIASLALFASLAFAAGDDEPAVVVRLDTDPAGAGVHASCLPCLAVDGAGTVHAAWQDERDDRWTIRGRRGPRLGASFDAADRLLSDPAEHSLEPRIAAVGAHVFVAWRVVAADGASEGVRVAVSQDGGESFGAPLDVAHALGPTDLVRDVQLVPRADGGAAVAWIEAVGAVDRLCCAASDATGTGFGAAAAITPASVTAVRATAAGDVRGGDLYLACIERSDEPRCDALVLHASSDGGATFPDARRVRLASTAPRALYDFSLGATAGGVVQLLWLEQRAQEQSIALCSQRSLARGAAESWRAAPWRVAAGRSVRSAALLVEPDGTALAALVAADPESGAPELATCALAPAAFEWSAPREVEAARGATALLAPRLGAPPAGGGIAVLGWLERRGGSTCERPRLAVRARAGARWRACDFDDEPSPARRRADALSFVLAPAGGGVRLLGVFEDRAGVARGATAGSSPFGAPEACCVGMDVR